MKILRVGINHILIDSQPCEPGYVWGQRWNKQLGEWSSQCMLWPSVGGVEVGEDDLPVIKPLEIER